MHVNGKDYIIIAGGNLDNNSLTFTSKVHVLSFDGSTLSIVTTINLPVAYDTMAGCTINVNGVDYAIFSGGRINNTKLASKIYYVLRFDGTNVKIVTQGELSTVMSSASALKIRINGNDSIALVCRSSVNILTNRGVYSNQSTLSSIPSSNAVLSKI